MWDQSTTFLDPKGYIQHCPWIEKREEERKWGDVDMAQYYKVLL